MSGRRPFSELTKDFTPERRRRIDAMKDEMKASMAVLLKFMDAFPDLHTEKKVNYTFAFEPCGYKGATVYFRKSKAGPNQARIHSGWLKNFPNADLLGAYLTRCKIPIDKSETHPDYLIGPEHADAVIAILKEGLARGTAAKRAHASENIAPEVTG